MIHRIWSPDSSPLKSKMANGGPNNVAFGTFIIAVLCLMPVAFSDDATPIPSDARQVESWFKQHVKPFAARRGTLDFMLEKAEVNRTVIRVRKDGSGHFKTIQAAIDSIPHMNTKRVIIYIGPGEYRERIKIERSKPFVTLYGHPNNKPLLISFGNAKQYGTVNSATLIVEAEYFSAVNLVIQNGAPRPTGKMAVLQQALAMRIAGDKASFYNCRFLGFQDTLCDNFGRHFFKDCYIEGTVDFIWGDGKSIYLNNELHVIPGDALAMITAQAGGSRKEDEGFSMVHCKVTGTGGNGYLGRAWMSYPKVVYSYCDLSDAVQKEGWFNSRNNANNKTVYFAEYHNSGPLADMKTRAKFTKTMSDGEARQWLSLGFIKGSSWLLPPVRL